MVSSVFRDYANPENPYSYAPLQGPTPPITISTHLSSSIYSLSTGYGGLPKLVFTITSHLQQPITICTYLTALDPHMGWYRVSPWHNYVVTDVDTERRIWLTARQPQRRYGLRRQLGHSNDRYYVTLMPGVPVTLSTRVPAMGWNTREPGSELFKPRGMGYEGYTFQRYFEPGHTYRIAVSYRIEQDFPPDGLAQRDLDQLVLWWRYGVREEVLELPGAPWEVTEQGWSENKIRLRDIPDVELTVDQ